MLIKASLLSLSLVAFTGQTPWPIVQGHHLQPNQRQTGHTDGDGVRREGRTAQPEVDVLYDEIMRASAPGGSNR